MSKDGLKPKVLEGFPLPKIGVENYPELLDSNKIFIISNCKMQKNTLLFIGKCFKYIELRI